MFSHNSADSFTVVLTFEHVVENVCRCDKSILLSSAFIRFCFMLHKVVVTYTSVDETFKWKRLSFIFIRYKVVLTLSLWMRTINMKAVE